MSSGGKRKYKTLRTTPLPRIVQAEIAEAARRARTGEAAQATDKLIRQGMHPLAAYQAARRGVRATGRRKAS